MYKNRSQGFTLIELLVVIAIIGVLSAVVLASLNTARTKGNDAAVKSNLSSAQTQSAIYYDEKTNYGTNVAALSPSAANCTLSGFFGSPQDPNVKAAIAAADVAAGGTSGTISKTVCATTAGGSSQAWVIATQLYNTANGAYFCVDSTGVAKSGDVPTGTACL